MLKVGLIGCGFMGSMHANCYNNIADAKVVAVADLRREKAEELAKISGAEIYATGKELIEKADVDVIDICLPTYLHAGDLSRKACLGPGMASQLFPPHL